MEDTTRPVSIATIHVLVASMTVTDSMIQLYRPVARLLERGVTKLCDNKDDMILCFSCNLGTYTHNIK